MNNLKTVCFFLFIGIIRGTPDKRISEALFCSLFFLFLPFGKRVSAYHIPVSMVTGGNNPHYYQV